MPRVAPRLTTPSEAACELHWKPASCLSSHGRTQRPARAPMRMHQRPGHGHRQPSTIGHPDPLGPRHPDHLLGVHRARQALGAPALDGLHRGLLRQRRGRVVPGPDAGRAARRRRWRTRVELANAIFEHLEIFHKRQRRHSSLWMRTPIEFEKMHAYPLEVA